MSRYWSFYWPLALTSLVMLLESQFQNGILARYPNAESELATFALATAGFQLVNAVLIFVPQMVTVLGRSPRSRSICLRFVSWAGLLLSAPLLVMGFTSFGERALSAALNIPPAVLPAVVRYLRWLAPLVWVNAMRQYCVGILVLAERTRAVTLLNALHLVTLVGILLMGRGLGWGALSTVALATIVSNLLHLVLSARVVGATELPKFEESLPPVSLKVVMAFFWPVATTSALFALSRPLLYAFVNLADDAVVTVAALRVSFDFAMLFQNPINQFRHVYTTFGAEDPRGVKRFIVLVTFWMVLAMAVVVFTPINKWLFAELLGIEGEVLQRAIAAMAVLCLGPIAIAVRNVYHGRLMVGRRTTLMAVGSLARAGVIGLLAWGLQRLGRLDTAACAAILVLGFAVEAAVARLASRHGKL